VKVGTAMSSKFAAIQAQLEKAGGGRKAPIEPPAAIETPPVKPPSREGKIHVGAYLSPDFKRSLRLVQAQTGEDTQTLIARALNDLFRAHNVPVVD
jgi:hypothetical protein